MGESRVVYHISPRPKRSVIEGEVLRVSDSGSPSRWVGQKAPGTRVPGVHSLGTAR